MAVPMAPLVLAVAMVVGTAAAVVVSVVATVAVIVPVPLGVDNYQPKSQKNKNNDFLEKPKVLAIGAA